MICEVLKLKARPLREHSLIELAALALSRVERSKISMEVTSDLGAFEVELASAGKPENYPMISPKWHDFASGDALGLILQAHGETIGGVAARFLDLGEDSLADHWESSYRRFYPGCDDPVKSRVAAAQKMRGRMVYEGELFLRKDWRGEQVNLPAITHYVHVLCALKWKPDWLYAFMRNDGLWCAPWYGWHHQHLAAHRWLRKVERRSDRESLVSVRYSELCERAEYLAANPDELPDGLLVRSGSNN